VTYDALYRLTQAVTGGDSTYAKWGLAMTYDRYGNRTAQSIASTTPPSCVSPMVCPTNSVTVSTTTNQITGSGYSYDASGNMTQDGMNTLTYDAENRTVSASGPLGSGSYVYDGNGLRVEKTVSGATTIYIFSGSKVIAEYASGASPSSPTKEYIYSGGALLATVTSSSTTYHHSDHLSVRMSTDTNGNDLADQGHFPYGETWYMGSGGTKWQFTTYERDAESGNDYAQARYNVNRLGRFSSPDPIPGSIADPQSLNRYSYVRNMPVMAIDPTGMCPDVATSPPRRRRKQGGGHLQEVFRSGRGTRAAASSPLSRRDRHDGRR